MTVLEYYKARNSTVGINMSDEALNGFLLSRGVDGTSTVSSTNSKEYDEYYLDIVKTILLKPDISEDSYSIEYDRKYVLKWYAAEAERLGVKDDISSSNRTVIDKSYLA